MATREITVDGVEYVKAPELLDGCEGCAAAKDVRLCNQLPVGCAHERIRWVAKDDLQKEPQAIPVAEYIKAIGADPLAQTHEMETFAPLAAVGGTKHDSGKPPMSLLDRKWLVGVAEVLGFGAQKYAAHNWRSGFKYSRLSDAALRHLTAFIDGEDLDPESGLSHLHHASCCLMFLSNMSVTHPELDDRWKETNEVDSTK